VKMGQTKPCIHTHTHTHTHKFCMYLQGVYKILFTGHQLYNISTEWNFKVMTETFSTEALQKYE
jgi:hypothetical protein